MFDTSFTRNFGITHPIAQAPMGRSAPPELAAAVSNAGGLGMLGMSWDDRTMMENRLKRTAELTSNPFSANFALCWDQSERVAQALDFGVPIISFFWGMPDAYMPTVRRYGAKSIITVGSVEEAQAALDLGADALCVQGWEAGGHVRSTIALLPLLCAVLDVVGTTPVIAAGGIANGRGLAAVLAAGGAGVWMGTRFLMSHESGAHPTYVDLLKGADLDATAMTEIFDTGWEDAPHRVLQNSTYAAWIEAGQPAHHERPGKDDIVSDKDGVPVKRYNAMAPNIGTAGDVEAMALYAGQSVGLLRDTLSATEIVRATVDEASRLIRALRN